MPFRAGQVKEKQHDHGCITDVSSFFRQITSEYICLEQNILQVISAMDSCSSEQILLQCKEILKQKETLARLDRQLFDILDFAGDEIGEDPMVHRCYTACKSANAACSTLYQRLLSLNTALQ